MSELRSFRGDIGIDDPIIHRYGKIRVRLPYSTMWFAWEGEFWRRWREGRWCGGLLGELGSQVNQYIGYWCLSYLVELHILSPLYTPRMSLGLELLIYLARDILEGVEGRECRQEECYQLISDKDGHRRILSHLMKRWFDSIANNESERLTNTDMSIQEIQRFRLPWRVFLPARSSMQPYITPTHHYHPGYRKPILPISYHETFSSIPVGSRKSQPCSICLTLKHPECHAVGAALRQYTHYKNTRDPIPKSQKVKKTNQESENCKNR